MEDAVAAFATTGKIKQPLVTIACTMDALLPIGRHARAYEANVHASRKGNDDRRSAQYYVSAIFRPPFSSIGAGSAASNVPASLSARSVYTDTPKVLKMR